MTPTKPAALVGLGWDRVPPTEDFDIDASALLVDVHGRVLTDAHFVFYNNLRSLEGSVEIAGQDASVYDSDDAVVKVNLAAVPEEVARVVIALSIYEAEAHARSFTQVRNVYMRVINQSDVSHVVMARYDLDDDTLGGFNPVILGELIRRQGEWVFRAVGRGYTSGLSGLAQDFGVNV